MITDKLTLFIVGLIITNLDFCKGFRVFNISGVETILAMANEDIKIQCKADIPMAYCGFIHPSGKRYAFSGSTLAAGQCSVKIKASNADSGKWRCHIGRKASIGVEVMQFIDLRVVKQLAAVKVNITAIHGKPVTLHCVTTKGLLPLRYCRFEPPSDKPFSINSDVNITNPIQGRYYFPNNKSLDRGDCAVTIRKVKYEDVGRWACGAGLDDGKEHIDTIVIDVEDLGFEQRDRSRILTRSRCENSLRKSFGHARNLGLEIRHKQRLYTMSTASATGIAFGAIGIAAFLAILGFIVWQKRRLLGSLQPDAEVVDAQELGGMRTPQRSPQRTPERSPQRSPERSPQGSPMPARHVPKLIVQSPSEPSTSPLLT